MNRFLSWPALALIVMANPSLAVAEKYDLLIQGGKIVDGTGAPWYYGDVAIEKGKIVTIGQIDASKARRVINAQGLIVAPGFIDMMGQTANPLLENPQSGFNLLTQGITTINCGEGSSAAPLGPDEAARRGYSTMAEYFQLLDMKGLPVNVVQTVGHTQVREIVLGSLDRRPSDEELERMKALVREAMEAGAIGVSTALIYPPATYAQTKEIAALAAVAGEHGGSYYTHMRNEGDKLLEAIDEAIAIGEAGSAPVHIYHLKAAGVQNWGKMDLAIARIQAARFSGQQVTADIYPYVNNGLGVTALIHPRHFAKGRDAFLRRIDEPAFRAEIQEEMLTTDGWENWFRHVDHDWNKIIIGEPGDKRYADYAGDSIAVIAQKSGEQPWDVFFNLVKSGAFALPESMTDANKIKALQQDFTSFCTDVGPVGNNRITSHPRGYGAFPRLFSKYVRDLGVISLERAVAQASAAAANKVLVYDRGRISEGQVADVIVFDYAAFTDKATFAKPHQASEGMKYVVINGQLVLNDGKYTGSLPGKVLRGPGYLHKFAPQAVSTGKMVAELASVDQTLASLLDRYPVPGAAVAISDHGRLVYSRGFGFADLATREPVQPDSLFRIASVSKPITAAAVLQLVDAGKLSLDDKVFDILHYEPIVAEETKPDPRQHAITIRHLLQHRGGWDRDKSFDAMFRSVDFANAAEIPPPADCDAIIRVMLGKRLDFDPGERYAYSNYGYCLLGRVIEKVSGQKYDEYVKQHVLAPLGIERMQIGASHLAGRAPREVRYYDPHFDRSVFAADLNQIVPHAYGAWYLEAMDSHGAWIASASDLARFACAFDNAETSLMLSAESLTETKSRPPGLAGYDQNGKPNSSYYSMGWRFTLDRKGQVTQSHSGSLPGTNTIVWRRPDGRNLVILLNSRHSPASNNLISLFLEEVNRTLDEISTWPQHDLFPKK